MIESNVVSITPNICLPKLSGFPVHVPGCATLDIPLLGVALASCLPLFAHGAVVAVLICVAMGQTVSHGFKHGGVNSWACATSTAADATLALGILIAKLGDQDGKCKEAGVAFSHSLGEGKVCLDEGLYGAVLFYRGVDKVVQRYHHIVVHLFFGLIGHAVEGHPSTLCKLHLAGKGYSTVGDSISPSHG